MLQAAGTSLEVAAALYHEDAEQAFLENYTNVDASTLYNDDSDDFEYWDNIEAFTLFMTGVNMHVLSHLEKNNLPDHSASSIYHGYQYIPEHRVQNDLC